MNNSQPDYEFEAGNNKKYEIDDIRNSMIFTKKLVT